MKRGLLILAAVALVVSVAGCSSSAPKEAAVSITDQGFRPESVTVQATATVTWTNNTNAPQSIKSDQFESAAIDPGGTFVSTFENSGTVRYQSAGQPAQTGTVVVK